MATKVKPIRLNITWNPSVGQVPTYVDDDTFQRWAGWWWSTPNDWILTIQKNWSTVATFSADTANNVTANITVPTVVDTLTSISTTDALSANQWNVLANMIANLQSIWNFISLWDATAWLPVNFPHATPYSYQTWDYYLVTNVHATTNYKPDWATYSGTASTVQETWDVQEWDMYVYNGSSWLLLLNHDRVVSFANLAWLPSDNTALALALAGKQDLLISWTNIKTINSNSLLWAWDLEVQWKFVEVIVNTAYWTAAKVWWTAWWNYVPTKWDLILVDFVYWNTATSPTLNIDWSWHKNINIWWYAATSATFTLRAWVSPQHCYVLMTYDGSNYVAFSTRNSQYAAATSTILWLCKLADDTVQSVSANAVSSTAWRTYWVQNNWNWQLVVNVPRSGWAIVSPTQPAVASQWDIWYDSTNDLLYSYDGNTWNIIWWTWDMLASVYDPTNIHADAFDYGNFFNTPVINVQEFSLSSLTDIATAQAAYDYALGWNMPIVRYNNKAYIFIWYSGSDIWFRAVEASSATTNSYSYLSFPWMRFYLTWGSVTSIVTNTMQAWSFLQTSTNYTTPYSPEYDWSPATKKYVDDRVYQWGTAPTTPVHGQIWYDTTNDLLKVYDWSNRVAVWGGWLWDVVWPNWAIDSHVALFDWTTWKLIKDGWDYNWEMLARVRVFKLASNTDLVTAQAAFDYYKNWWLPIILHNTYYYYFSHDTSSELAFYKIWEKPNDWVSTSTLQKENTLIRYTWTTVTSITSWTTWLTNFSFLRPNKDYITPYTPQYDGSPATKKYVDDKISDTAFDNTWDWVTTIAPSKNAVYDIITTITASIPTVPTVVSAFTNDAWYITWVSWWTWISVAWTTITNSLPFNPWNAGSTWDVLKKTSLWYEWSAPTWIQYTDFAFNTAASGWTVTISNLSTKFTPTQNFTIAAWTWLYEWMQYILRLTTWATAYTITLWTWVTNPFTEDLTLTANKTTTIVFLATSSSALEIFSVRTAD